MSQRSEIAGDAGVRFFRIVIQMKFNDHALPYGTEIDPNFRDYSVDRY